MHHVMIATTRHRNYDHPEEVVAVRLESRARIIVMFRRRQQPFERRLVKRARQRRGESRRIGRWPTPVPYVGTVDASARRIVFAAFATRLSRDPGVHGGAQRAESAQETALSAPVQ